MEKVLDTMIWIHALWKESKYREEARKIIKESEERIVVPFNIALEIFNVLTRDIRMDKRKAYKFILLLLSKYRRYIPKEEDYLRALEIAKNHNISVSDALIISICRNNNFELITFDRKLKNLL